MTRTARQKPLRTAPESDHGLGFPIRIVDRQDEPGPQDDIDLAQVGLPGVEKSEEDNVNDPVGQLELRALVPLDDVLGDERVET